MSDFQAALQRAKEIALKLGAKRKADDDSPEDPSKKATIAAPSRYGGLGTVTTAGTYAAKERVDKTKKEFYIPKQYVGLVIGKSGDTMKRIESECRCKIQFNPDDAGDYRYCALQGDENYLTRAKELIDELCNWEVGASEGKAVIHFYSVPLNKVNDIIEASSRIEKLTGVALDISTDASKDDPRKNSRVMTVTGNAVQVTDSKRQLDEICGSGANTQQIYVIEDKVGLVIGRGGEGIKHITSSCNVKLAIDQEGGPQGRLITITGSPEDIENAKWMVDERLGPQNRSRYANQYQGDGTEDPYATYGYSGEDPYKAQLMQQQQLQQEYPQGYEGYAEGQYYDPAAYQQASSGDPAADYAAWYAYYYPDGTAEQREAEIATPVIPDEDQDDSKPPGA